MASYYHKPTGALTTRNTTQHNTTQHNTTQHNTTSNQRLDRLQARISRASLALGGLERLARRLHATLVGGGPGGAEDQEEASLAEFKQRLGDAYNLRWRLLSSAIDHACRWVFVLAYVCSVVATAIVLTANPGHLFDQRAPAESP
jgi:hypothetical protein